MNTALTLLISASLSVAAVAQQTDTITWSDGTVADGARVTDYTVFQIQYTLRGTRSQEASDRVVALDVGRVRDAFRRGLSSGDPAQLLTSARERLKENEKFLAQFGFYHAARLFLADGNQTDGFATLDELKSAIPDSGFLPHCFRLKIEHLLAQGREGGTQAGALADAYLAQVKSAAMPEGFALEAEFLKAVAELTAGALDPASLQSRLGNLLVKVSGPYPSLGNRVKLWIATSTRLQGRSEDAKKLFQELAQANSVDIETRAGAYLGLGHVAFAQGDANNTDRFREALLAFLRVYMETKEASPAVVAEALHFASESAKRWGGRDWNFMSGKLERILSQEYAGTTWAKGK